MVVIVERKTDDPVNHFTLFAAMTDVFTKQYRVMTDLDAAAPTANHPVEAGNVLGLYLH